MGSCYLGAPSRVIASFYTGALEWSTLADAVAVIAALAGLHRAGAKRPLTYALLGVVLWLFVLSSGIQATIAGVLLAPELASVVNRFPSGEN